MLFNCESMGSRIPLTQQNLFNSIISLFKNLNILLNLSPFFIFILVMVQPRTIRKVIVVFSLLVLSVCTFQTSTVYGIHMINQIVF